MSRASLSSLLRRAAALLVLGAAGLGCGGIGPGDYVFYRVAYTNQVKQSKGCFDNGVTPADEKSDKTTFRASNLFIIYGGTEEGEDQLYLDTGEVVLPGLLDADIYSFTATATDVNYTDIDGGGDKHTFTKKVTIEFTLDGTELYGQEDDNDKNTCSGNTCDLTMPIQKSCTKTWTFVGTEVEDVEFHHDI